MVSTCYRFSRLSVCSHCFQSVHSPALVREFFRLTRLQQEMSCLRSPLRFPGLTSPDALDCGPRYRFHLPVYPDCSQISLGIFRCYTLWFYLSAVGLGACTRGCPFGTHPVIRLQPSVPADFICRRPFMVLRPPKPFGPGAGSHRLLICQRATVSFVSQLKLFSLPQLSCPKYITCFLKCKRKIRKFQKTFYTNNYA